jgi:hypothetical protein
MSCYKHLKHKHTSLLLHITNKPPGRLSSLIQIKCHFGFGPASSVLRLASCVVRSCIGCSGIWYVVCGMCPRVWAVRVCLLVLVLGVDVPACLLLVWLLAGLAAELEAPQQHRAPEHPQHRSSSSSSRRFFAWNNARGALLVARCSLCFVFCVLCMCVFCVSAIYSARAPI